MSPGCLATWVDMANSCSLEMSLLPFPDHARHRAGMISSWGITMKLSSLELPGNN